MKPFCMTVLALRLSSGANGRKQAAWRGGEEHVEPHLEGRSRE